MHLVDKDIDVGLKNDKRNENKTKKGGVEKIYMNMWKIDSPMPRMLR